MSVVPTVHLRDLHPRAKIFTIWEKQRRKEEVHWAMECFAEMVRAYITLLVTANLKYQLGVFFYVYFGEAHQKHTMELTQ